MRLLLDTHLLLWIVTAPGRLPSGCAALIEATAEEVFFSAASIWEVAIKQGLGRTKLHVDADLLHRTLLRDGFIELPVLSTHARAVATLPPLHKDPFDRLLLAQAIVENLTLLTADATLARYPGPVRLA
ncbi:type II toxin-antitoxin system VapC family toxin [Methylobacterium sp. NEAU 140]|uniref:type II toxin-antitoxin system VapC family toxin n=1 Tax=Methylobacterium sp. NEAU 140 TaxID=3064945 RepID=UPI00273368FA|nr:type II toxin-antitoxin system VapC family toxin [Methylobacterium sp. NEAU 140]MDP4024569.1 type II toxin-antitoxin system VapC family toxin [Methylobacterium sp. NEAU 140]